MVEFKDRNAFFRRDIQMSSDGHNPCEDALATMELVLQKLKHGRFVGHFHCCTPIYP